MFRGLIPFRHPCFARRAGPSLLPSAISNPPFEIQRPTTLHPSGRSRSRTARRPGAQRVTEVPPRESKPQAPRAILSAATGGPVAVSDRAPSRRAAVDRGPATRVQTPSPPCVPERCDQGTGRGPDRAPSRRAAVDQGPATQDQTPSPPCVPERCDRGTGRGPDRAPSRRAAVDQGPATRGQPSSPPCVPERCDRGTGRGPVRHDPWHRSAAGSQTRFDAALQKRRSVGSRFGLPGPVSHGIVPAANATIKPARACFRTL